MTTSDVAGLDLGGLGLGTQGDALALAERGAALAAGLPDPAQLTRLASDMLAASGEFTRRFGDGQLLGAASAPPTDVLSLGSSSSALPAGLPVAAPSVAQAAAFPLSTTPVPAIPSTLPAVPPAPRFEDFASFGFLRDARPLFAAAPALPLHAVPVDAGVRVPGEGDARRATSSLPGVTVPTSTQQFGLDPASPHLGGTPQQVAGFEQRLGLDFLDLARPLGGEAALAQLGPTTNELAKAPSATGLASGIDVEAVRRDFPILNERVNGRQLVWLDNAATTQKPNAVIDRLSQYYRHENSNIHRAAHELAARATDAYEHARQAVARFLGASSSNEIIFVRGATEGINLVANTWGKKNIGKDDEILVTVLEHHANIVPWQMLCAVSGAKLRVAPVDDTGQVILEEYERLLGPRTKLVAIAHVSNALGTIVPVHEMVAAAKRHGAATLVDGSQAVSHMAVDVQSIGCDFYVFSGHKVFAPTGIGVVFGRADVLEDMPPYQGGGNMIADVTFDRTTFQPPPFRFEAGTGSIADAVGLGAAIEYVERLGMGNIARYEHDLLVYATEALKTIPGLRPIGTATNKASVLSFVLDGYRTEDVGRALNSEGIAVRSGHHCAQPILRRFGLESTVRPSLAFYNTCEEVDKLVAAIWNLKQGRKASVV